MGREAYRRVVDHDDLDDPLRSVETVTRIPKCEFKTQFQGVVIQCPGNGEEDTGSGWPCQP